MLHCNKVIILWSFLHCILSHLQILSKSCHFIRIFDSYQIPSDFIQLQYPIGAGIHQLLLLLQCQHIACLLIDCNDRPKSISCYSNGTPLGMFFGDPHACNGFEFQVLSRAKFNNGDTLIVRSILLLLIQKVGWGNINVIGQLEHLIFCRNK